MGLLRLAKESDFDFFYRIKCDEDNVFWCGYADKPSKNNLLKFWQDNIGNGCVDTSRYIYIVENDREAVGYVYIDVCNEITYEVSIAIISEHAGMGYATKAVNEVLDMLKKKKCEFVQAFIREDNNRSQHIFEKCGFSRREDFYEINPEGQEGVVRMLKYVYIYNN